jgi:hypothetical protein
MQNRTVLKILILIVFTIAIAISAFNIHVKAKEAYASDNELISKLELILAGQKQIEAKLELIRRDLDTVKTSIENQENAR